MVLVHQVGLVVVVEVVVEVVHNRLVRKLVRMLLGIQLHMLEVISYLCGVGPLRGQCQQWR